MIWAVFLIDKTKSDWGATQSPRSEEYAEYVIPYYILTLHHQVNKCQGVFEKQLELYSFIYHNVSGDNYLCLLNVWNLWGRKKLKWNDYTLNELDIELVFLMHDELKEILGDKALMKSGFLNLLQKDPIYVHHFDEDYWVERIVEGFQRSVAR